MSCATCRELICICRVRPANTNLHSVQLNLTAREIAMLDEIMGLTDTHSHAQVFRAALLDYHQQLTS